MVQYLVLANSHKHPDLLAWTDNVRLLEALKKRSILQSHECEELTQAYIAYRSWAHRRALQNQKLLFEPNELAQAGLITHIDTVSNIWNTIMDA